MTLQEMFGLLQPINDRLHTIEQAMSRRFNMIAFLVVRFVLMSGMVVGFTWWSLNLSP